MNGAKPIEAGCLAIIIAAYSESFGAIVTVIEKTPEPIGPDEGEWVIDLKLKVCDGVTTPGGWAADSCQLMRIDDDRQKEIDRILKKTDLIIENFQ